MELLIVFVVLALLVAVGVPSYGLFVERAKRAACMGKIRRLHTSLGSYTVDKGHWPQVPVEDTSLTDDDINQKWVDALSPYGIALTDWICPADRYQEPGHRHDTNDDPHLSYVVTAFDGGSSTPYRWQQPWVSERFAFHPGGILMIMPDGSISTIDVPLIR